MPAVLKYALLGALILAGVMIVIPALMSLGLYALAIIGALAIVRKLFPQGLLSETSETDGEELKRAKTPQ